MEALAFFALYRKGSRWTSKIRKIETIANMIIFIAGIFILIGGCYSSISASESRNIYTEYQDTEAIVLLSHSRL